MPKQQDRVLINNLTGGELSPLVDARMDLQQFFTGCRTLQNCLIYPQGGAFKRPGTQYVAGTTDNGLARLIPFTYSDSDAYAIEFSDYLIRLYRTVAGVPGLIATDAGATYSIVSPYAAADLALLQYRQSGDVMYISHPSYKPRRLVRTSHNDWAISAVPFEHGPFLKQNDTETTMRIQGYTIDTTNTGAGGSFIITGDGNLWWSFLAGRKFIIEGSTANDGEWTVLSTDYTGTNFTINVIASETVLASATSGTAWPNLEAGSTVELAASAVVFNPQHVGALWQLGTSAESVAVEGIWKSVNGTSDSLAVAYQQKVDFVTTESWSGTVVLEVSYDQENTWTTYYQMTYGQNGNIEIHITNDVADAHFRVVRTGAAVGWCGYHLITRSFIQQGVIEIDTYVSPSTMRGTVKSAIARANTPSKFWAEGAWSDYRGWPAAIDFFEQRLFFAGTTYDAVSFWGSKSYPGGDYHNFLAGDLADAALAFTVSEAQQDPIKWLVHDKRLIAGTSGGPFTLGATKTTEPLTPTNVIHPERISDQGSAAIAPVLTSIGYLYVENGGKRVYEMSYSWEAEGLVTADMTRLATHITAGGITEIAMQRRPEPIFWAVTGNGKLICLTYLRKEEITAWAVQVTNGTFESVCVIPGADGDDVWVVVKRTINGSDVRYVEKFKPWSFANGSGDPEDNFLVDCGLTYSDVATNSIGGLGHLIGETVSILAQGGNHADKVVSALGYVTLDDDLTVTDAQIGLPYTAIIKPMKIPQGELLAASLKRITEWAGNWYNTGYAEYGSDNSVANSDMDIIEFREADDEADVPELFTGSKELDWPGGFEDEGNVIIQSDRPLPMCVLSLTMLVEAE